MALSHSDPALVYFHLDQQLDGFEDYESPRNAFIRQLDRSIDYGNITYEEACEALEAYENMGERFEADIDRRVQCVGQMALFSTSDEPSKSSPPEGTPRSGF